MRTSTLSDRNATLIVHFDTGQTQFVGGVIITLVAKRIAQRRQRCQTHHQQTEVENSVVCTKRGTHVQPHFFASKRDARIQTQQSLESKLCVSASKHDTRVQMQRSLVNKLHVSVPKCETRV